MNENFDKLYTDGDPSDRASFGELVTTFVREHRIAVFIVAFLIVAAVILTVQGINKTEYELYLMYCGPTYAASADIYGNIIEATKKACADGDDYPEVAFSTIVYVSDELADYYQKEGIEYNGAYNAEALQNFDYALAAGEYCIMLLDRSLYDNTKDLDVFVPLSDLGISTDDAYDSCAFNLKSLSIASKPGYSSLPEDTVLVLRKKSFIQNLFANKKKIDQRYEAQCEFFKQLATSN